MIENLKWFAPVAVLCLVIGWYLFKAITRNHTTILATLAQLPKTLRPSDTDPELWISAVRRTIEDIMLTSASISGAMLIRYYQIKRWLASVDPSTLRTLLRCYIVFTTPILLFLLARTSFSWFEKLEEEAWNQVEKNVGFK